MHATKSKFLALFTTSVLAASVSVWAQTNAVPLPTNAVAALTNAGPVRPISLQECFDLALKNNLSLQIERINPLLAYEGLRIAQGYYDPTLSSGYTHSRNTSGGSFQNGIVILPSSTDVDSFSTGINGYGPYGFTYGVRGSASSTDGTSSGVNIDKSSGDGTFTVSQPLLKGFLMDNGRYNIALSKNTIKQTEQQLLLTIMGVLNQVEQAYYDLMFARENIRVQQMALELAARSLDENRKRVQIGVLAPLDEKQAQSQVAARETDLTSALRNYNTYQNNLKKLLTAQYRDLHDVQLAPTIALVAVPYPVDLHESWSRALSQRPDLLEARLNLERQGITLKYAKNQLLPELDIRGSIGYNGFGSDFPGTFDQMGASLHDSIVGKSEPPVWTAGAVVSYPLFNRVARGNYKQSKLNVEQAVLNLKSREEGVLVQVDEDVNQLKSAWAQVASTKAERIYAEDALTAEQKKLEAGKSTSFVVLRLQNDLTSARYSEIAAKANYNKIQSQLAFDEGNTLKRNNINVQIK